MLDTCAALFIRRDSIYKEISGVDCYDIDRDATSYSGSLPVIAHPPCRSWGKLAQFSKPRPGERDLAFFALDTVRKNGGVLEHPIHSRLRVEGLMPEPGQRDSFGGFILGVNQSWWGHPAEKSTLLYICGIDPKNIPSIPLTLNSAITTVENMSRRQREITPSAFAHWLVDLAMAVHYA